MSQAEAAIDVAAAGDVIADKLDSMETENNEPEKKEVEQEEESSEITEDTEESPETDETEEEDISEDSNESDDKPADEPEEESADTFESVADLAEALDMKTDEFLESIKQTVKINGEEMEVNLKDLTAGYQMEQDYRRKTTELSEQRKGFEAEKEQSASQIQAKFQEAEAISANLEQQLMGEYNNIDWNQLEMQDREEWLVQRQKFSERAQQLETTKTQIQSELQQRNEQTQAQHQQEFQEHLTKENEALLAAIPEWSDNDVRGAEVTEMTDYLKSYGFSEEESNQIFDHRIMRLVRDAYKGANKNQKVDIVKKKVKTLPKIVKPSVKIDKRAAKKRASADTWSKYKQSGSMDDLTAHLASKL